MPNPASLADIFIDTVRLVTSGLNRRIKSTTGDLKIVDVADVAGRLPYGQLVQGAALTVVANAANALGDFAALPFAADGHVLKRSGTTLVTAFLDTINLNDNAITALKIATDAVTTIKIQAGAVTFAKRSELIVQLALTGTPANASPYTIAQDKTIGTWPAISGTTEQQVPEAGEYMIDICGAAETSLTTNPIEIIVGPAINSVVTPGIACRNRRFSAVATDRVGINGTLGPFTIATPASQKFSFQNLTPGTNTQTPTTLKAVIRKVSN